MLIAAAGVLLVLVAAGGIAAYATSHRTPSSVSPSAPQTPGIVSMYVTVTLADSDGVLNLDDVHCEGMGGYDDMRAGAQVTVTDEHGTVIGDSTLPTGQMQGSGVTRQCVFTFTVDDLPKGRSFYGLTISHRGTTQVREWELGSVNLSLGG
jgi:putative hemolysin